MFPSLYLQTIYFRPQSGDADLRGMKTYGPPVTISARVEPTTRLIRNRDGEQIAASAQLFFDASHEVNERGLFFVPDLEGDPNNISTGVQAITASRHRHLLTGALSHWQVFL